MPAVRLGWMVIMLLILALVSACDSGQSAQYTALPASGVSTPTPVIVIYHSATPLPATATPVPAPSMTPNNDPDYYYGGMVITMNDAGRTILLKKRQNFLLSLGKNYNWQVVVEPDHIISTNANITPEPGDQGIFIARDSGKAVLRAVGEPLCRYAQPPCVRPNVLFQIEVQVE